MATPAGAVFVRPHAMEDLCMVAPAPEVRRQLLERYNELKESSSGTPDCNYELSMLQSVLHPMATNSPGLNDAVSRPGNAFRPGMASAAKPVQLRGEVKVIVVMVYFEDKKFTQEQDKGHYERLWFSKGAKNGYSVRDYFSDASNGKVDIKGEVVGPFRMPNSLAHYANSNSGKPVDDRIDTPSSRTMARDAAQIANSHVDFKKYNNNQDEYVDHFVIVHAGVGAENASTKNERLNNIWSHKHVLPGDGFEADGTIIYPYLTVPADCKLGVCAHELGHLAFGWPDLYDVSNVRTQNGVGNWCLMGSGSHNGSGIRPAHPSAWCKVQQGWVDVDIQPNTEKPQRIKLADVKDEHKVLKLWKDGKPEHEYFLLENRQQKGNYDEALPSHGLLLWHIDETKAAPGSGGNSSEMPNYMVALVQSDGQKDLENAEDAGDAGDPFPGPNNAVRKIHSNTNPSTRANDGNSSGVSISNISDSGPVMTFEVRV